MNPSRFFPRPFLGVLVLLTLACALVLATAQAQQPASTGQDIQIIRLKNAQAENMSRLLQNLLDPEVSKKFRLTYDAATNSLFVSGTPEQVALINRYVVMLDDIGSSRPAEETKFRVLPLGRLVAGDALQVGLDTVIPKHTGHFALDRERGLLIVSGDERTIQRAQEFLARLEKAQEKPARKEMRVRVVWLASGLAPKGVAPPPQDIKKAVLELAALGIEDLRLISQSIINVTTGTEFKASGVAQLNSPRSIAIVGMLFDRPGEDLTLQLSVDVGSLDGKATGFSRLSTQIVTRPGHSVVLGVTPTETTTSVFVVQVLPVK